MPLRFTLRQLEYFVAVGEVGSIAAASEAVNVSSPSISAAIVQLEAEFGFPLFVRKHAHGLTLTQGGRRFLEHAKLVLKNANNLNNLANEITGQIRGPLTIGCLLTFAQLILPQLRREFSDIYPDVEINQLELHQAAILEKLRLAEIDIALTYNLSIPADLIFEPLLDLPPYAILSQNHPLADRKSVTPDDLIDHDMILLDLPFSREYFLSFFKKCKKPPNITERTQDLAVVRSMVANDFGYSLVNIKPLTDLSPDGKALKFVPLICDVKPMTVGLLMGEGAKNLVTINAFIEHCKESIGGGGLPGLRAS